MNYFQILDFLLIVSKILPSVHFGASSYALCVRNDLLIYAGHLRECISFCFVFVTYYVTLNRSSRWQIFLKIGALKNLAIFTRKHLCWSFFNYVSGSVAASDWSEIHFEKIFILILIKLKLMWYALVCFVANLICDRKILLTASSSYKLDLSAFEQPW